MPKLTRNSGFEDNGLGYANFKREVVEDFIESPILAKTKIKDILFYMVKRIQTDNSARSLKDDRRENTLIILLVINLVIEALNFWWW